MAFIEQILEAVRYMVIPKPALSARLLGSEKVQAVENFLDEKDLDDIDFERLFDLVKIAVDSDENVREMFPPLLLFHIARTWSEEGKYYLKDAFCVVGGLSEGQAKLLPQKLGVSSPLLESFSNTWLTDQKVQSFIGFIKNIYPHVVADPATGDGPVTGLSWSFIESPVIAEAFMLCRDTCPFPKKFGSLYLIGLQKLHHPPESLDHYFQMAHSYGQAPNQPGFYSRFEFLEEGRKSQRADIWRMFAEILTEQEECVTRMMKVFIEHVREKKIDPCVNGGGGLELMFKRGHGNFLFETFREPHMIEHLKNLCQANSDILFYAAFYNLGYVFDLLGSSLAGSDANVSDKVVQGLTMPENKKISRLVTFYEGMAREGFQLEERMGQKMSALTNRQVYLKTVVASINSGLINHRALINKLAKGDVALDGLLLALVSFLVDNTSDDDSLAFLFRVLAVKKLVSQTVLGFQRLYGPSNIFLPSANEGTIIDYMKRLVDEKKVDSASAGTKSQKTALHQAAKAGHRARVEFLCNLNPKLKDMKDGEGKTFSDYMPSASR